MASAAVFGKPETGGVVFALPDDEQAERATRTLRVAGHITIHIDVWEEFVTDADDEDEIIEAALERAGVDLYVYGGVSTTYCDIIELDHQGRTNRKALAEDLVAWKKGEPIRVDDTPISVPLLEVPHA
jgi:hypothetical protein